jgi:hypothetical protein
MRKLALALAAAATLGFMAPVLSASDASAAQTGMQDSKTDVSSAHRRGHVKKVIVRRDRGHHRHGWNHRHQHGGKKVVIIKKRR